MLNHYHSAAPYFRHLLEFQNHNPKNRVEFEFVPNKIMSTPNNAQQQANVFYIRSKLSTPLNPLYLDIAANDESKLAAHQRLIINTFKGNATQQFIITESGFIRPFANKKLVLDVKGIKGPEVILYQQNSGANQQWEIKGDIIFSRIEKGNKVC